ncbi:MAG: hypothetical protein GYA55_02290 [SAR324 cluster bacterium]|uniref:Type II secretion system protein M n=1 Tax=SAR324 cluster bacterium TaxID=2024889 RepID=A0A7X9IIF0_9DELT|nr:hypothetical protein [SAR324 cluster bacterium]
MSITKLWHTIIFATKTWFEKLSSRERRLIIIAAIAVVLMLVYGVCTKTYQAFVLINSNLSYANEELATVSDLLSQYSKAKAQRDRIENEFRSVEFKEGELTYLEELIKKKLNLSSGFTITPRAVTKFGVNYEQHPFTVKFSLSDLKLIMEFLNEIISGPQPLLLTRLDIRMTRNGETLEVDMDVSSIKEVRSQAS